MKLRPYQNEALAAIRKDWSGGARNVIISMPTGSGKTVVFLFLIHNAKKNGHRCIVLVNTDELVQQTVAKLGRVGIAAGIVKANKNEWRRPVVVASVQTLSRDRRLRYIPTRHFGLAIVDECHFANSVSYQKVLKHLDARYTLGVTATPFRGDNQSLADAGWEAVSYIYSMDQAVADGFLVPLNIERVDTGVVLRARTHASSFGEEDFADRPLSIAVNTPERNERIVSAYRERINGRKVLAFCVSVEHAWALANAFRKQGIMAGFVHGFTPRDERRKLIDAHKAGRFRVLVNCNVLTHGYDDPSLEGIVMARPTLSKVLYMQCIGRGLRPYEGKDSCDLLDVVDVSRTHETAINAEILGLQREMGQVTEESPDLVATEQNM